jgi:hypothetical protein
MPMAHQFCRHSSTVQEIVQLCALARIQVARQRSSRQRVAPVTVIRIPTMDSQIHAAHDTNIHATVSNDATVCIACNRTLCWYAGMCLASIKGNPEWILAPCYPLSVTYLNNKKQHCSVILVTINMTVRSQFC